MHKIPLFYHPDYTVGFGIAPNQPVFTGSQALTAGGELHPAPKNINFKYILYYIIRFVKRTNAKDTPKLPIVKKL